MWIDNGNCKLCLVYSRTKDLVALGYQHRIPEMLLRLAEIVEKEGSRAKAFAESFEYVKLLTRAGDPYAETKRSLRELGKNVARIVERHLEAVNWDVKEALRLSAAANIIDTSVLGYENAKSLEEAIWDKPVIEDVFELEKGTDIYLVLDNAGEAEIDKLLAKSLIMHGYSVTLVVREKTYEIDETVESLEKDGLDVMATPGSMPPIIYVNKGFAIAKGIANAEAYAEFGKTQSLHLFRAKCEVIARRLGVPKNSVLILSSNSIKRLFGGGS
jgi:hypothetical protein